MNISLKTNYQRPNLNIVKKPYTSRPCLCPLEHYINEGRIGNAIVFVCKYHRSVLAIPVCVKEVNEEPVKVQEGELNDSRS